MKEKLLIKNQDLVDNPTPRVPVCLCLDTSSSMYGKPIDELNEGVHQFYEAINADDTAKYAAEISLVTFGGYKAECVADFASVDLRSIAPKLAASGMTPMGEAVNLALDMLEKRKEEYMSKGVDYYQPWLVLMTDGAPNGNSEELTRAINRTVDLVNEKKLVVFPIGIGKDANMKVLADFSPRRTPLMLKDLKFREFFAWLSQSVSRTSQSIPGETVELDYDRIKTWADLD